MRLGETIARYSFIRARDSSFFPFDAPRSSTFIPFTSLSSLAVPRSSYFLSLCSSLCLSFFLSFFFLHFFSHRLSFFSFVSSIARVQTCVLRYGRCSCEIAAGCTSGFSDTELTSRVITRRRLAVSRVLTRFRARLLHQSNRTEGEPRQRARERARERERSELQPEFQ